MSSELWTEIGLHACLSPSDTYLDIMVDKHLQAKPILQSRNVSKLLDPSLGSEYEHEYIERMVLAATVCISLSPQTRPQISLVGFYYPAPFLLSLLLFPLMFVKIAEPGMDTGLEALARR